MPNLDDELLVFMRETVRRVETGELKPWLIERTSGGSSMRGTAGDESTSITFITRDAEGLGAEVIRLRKLIENIKEVVDG